MRSVRMLPMIRWAVACIGLVLVCSCAKQRLVLEFHASIQYEKPEISRVSHELADTRRDGGTVVVRVTVDGDPGLEASFDITPDIATAQPMQEVADGSYVGEFAFPPDTVGGPYAVIGRLSHEKAGEIVLRDPASFSISLLR